MNWYTLIYLLWSYLPTRTSTYLYIARKVMQTLNLKKAYFLKLRNMCQLCITKYSPTARCCQHQIFQWGWCVQDNVSCWIFDIDIRNTLILFDQLALINFICDEIKMGLITNACHTYQLLSLKSKLIKKSFPFTSQL